jgi:hypothetical protein
MYIHNGLRRARLAVTRKAASFACSKGGGETWANASEYAQGFAFGGSSGFHRRAVWA